MKNKNLKLSMFALIGTLAVSLFFSPYPSAEAQAGEGAAQAEASMAAMDVENIILRRADGEELIFNVELAVTPAQQAQGFMNRPSLDRDSGMLFIFNGLERRSFWMKNTLIPLDLLFLGKDGTIDHIHHHAKPLDETLLTSLAPAMAVLEINGGLSDTLDINVGDKVYHNAFRNMNLLAE